MNNDKKNKHLSLEDRITILEELKKGTNLITIANKIKKDPTTISKEIQKHRYSKDGSHVKSGSGYLCSKRNICTINCVCGKRCTGLLCKQCTSINCTIKCKDYEPYKCKLIHRFPYTCFTCDRRISCKLTHYFYDPKLADKEYHDELKDSRIGINMTVNELKQIDNIVTDGVKRGLSIYAIIKSNPEINISERTIYRYVEQKYLSCDSIDLRRKVTYKKRYKSKINRSEVNKYRKNRLHIDYLNYIIENPSIKPVQLDLVIGCISDKQVLLTIHFPIPNLMIGFLINDKTPSSVSSVFNYIQSLIGIDAFKEIFPVILTDRGSEFYHPENIEFDNNTGELRTKLFYCDSYSSSQKAQIERNHEFIRYYLPQGTSFNNLTQEKINLMFSHINSYPRESKKNNCPYDIFSIIYGREFLDKLKITRIEPGDLILQPYLLK